MFYFVHTPWWLRRLYPGCRWEMPAAGKTLYLSFDDGPHPEATPFVLDQLAQYQARATFFCIGKNVAAHRELYRDILDKGHRVGNHTYHHLNGWKTTDEEYLADIRAAKEEIDSRLFRPPYGRIRRFQLRLLQGKGLQLQTIMWTVLSGDFDPAVSGERCAARVIRYARDGSIVVFHDSAKALPSLRVALPAVLKYFTEKGYRFETIREDAGMETSASPEQKAV